MAGRVIAPIIGVPYSFRTLHPPGRTIGREDVEQTLHLDKIMVVTLPRITALAPHATPARIVDL